LYEQLCICPFLNKGKFKNRYFQYRFPINYLKPRMEEAIQIVTAINKGQIKPIYFLMREEPYYIDKIADFIE
jgi:hypothetical protein